MARKPKLYGAGVQGEGLKQAPHADHIQGGLLEFGSDDQPTQVRLFYLSDRGPTELTMSFQNAIFLLSILKAMQLDTGIPFPDDPRGS